MYLFILITYTVFVDLTQDPCTTAGPFWSGILLKAYIQKYLPKTPCISVAFQKAVLVLNTLYSYWTGLEMIFEARSWLVVFLWCLQQGSSWPNLRRYHNVPPCDAPLVEDCECTGNCKIWKINIHCQRMFYSPLHHVQLVILLMSYASTQYLYHRNDLH